MNKELQTLFHYHETTKHSQKRYAKSLGYMDWATQPDPFRMYQGTKSIALALSFDNPTPPYSLLDEELPSAPLMLESLSQLLQFSMGIAAWKSSGGSSWAVRCNASSGNLHPTETYLVLPPISENTKSTVAHYAPKNHSLEILTEFESDFFDTLPKESFVVALSSIAWREAWKYGERAFRYVQLDAGHAWQALAVSAKMLGWKITRVESVSDAQIAKIIGLDQKNRFFEEEKPDMLLIVSKEEISPGLDVAPLTDALPNKYEGTANKLSPSVYEWKIIDEVEKATSVMQIPQVQTDRCKVAREPSRESKEVVLGRRSVHVMDKEKSKISKKQFHTLLKSVDCSLDGKANAAHLAIFVHRVEEYAQGLYLHVRNQKDLEHFKKEFHDTFLWKKTDFENLYLLETADFTKASKIISCNQDIASDGAFSLGMICRYSEELLAFNAHRYKELYWECGMIGQQLYLEATSLGLSGTGIGCFLDDLMNVNVLGLKNNLYQSLYHFTVGRGYVDSRIETTPAY
ncbi:SagB family peptide dehydrogenase [Sulfurimonas sp. ST-27]|uniref:SagB family peptide dehydrogenase n=1 Tax=Sulfurimonas sp. ST-27 TaxID=3400152 RepID=UPI003AB71577